ncbi:nad dependent epimerase dehydratase [Stylonychia lemnae]|uniref:Nad dependent epimerase dehydratase n=1 Tax=Stylonychia lemnae TaxID=5949 RepID=A0A078AWD8_STYLE|nr:nad dependent epimerase dehydratase [Stylonychia lemnae]|eukprot:CDW85557.1 nad dependent epimerase dehydratase [Stylonychia lemnae]
MAQQRIFITGVTGYLGSHLAKAISTQIPNTFIMGTTKSIQNTQKISEFRQVFQPNQVELIDADMFKSRDCFIRNNVLEKIDMVVHTAAPLIQTSSKGQQEEQIKMYLESTQNLIESAIRNKVKKFVFIGAASSVIGQHPVKDKGFIYNDPNVWVEPKTIVKPNERAKILSEKICWNAIRKQDPSNSNQTQLISLLPYFMTGPPLYKSIIDENSSCQAIASILNNSQYGFPEVQLPIVDVRDVVQAHLSLIKYDPLKQMSGRFLVSSESKWFSEIIEVLKSDRKVHGKKIKTRILGNFTLSFGRIINPEISHLMPFVDQPIHIDGSEFSRVFNIKYRSAEQSIKEMAIEIVNMQKQK